jgi:predicted kinase
MEALIFIGIQATGKSTFYHERFFNSHIRLNLDMLKTRHREKILLIACLNAKQPFVVDNTNPTAEERSQYIELAHQAKFRVIGYYFQSKLEEALKRNSQREGKEQIPEKGIRGTYAKLEIPNISEGFDELYYIVINKDNSFSILEWKDEVR